ncbi:MAG: PilZ domain-containing protein [Thermoanaerobaculia bacterium]
MVDKPGSPYSPPRRAPRVPADGIQLSVEGAAARLIDLSEQGLRFVGDQAFEEGHILHATMRAGAEEVSAEGTVKWCRPEGPGRYNIGISFRGSNDQALRKGIFALFMAAG